VAIDFGAMLGKVAARDSDYTPAPKIHRNEHQAAARGEVVANSNRLLTARPRRSNHLCPHQAVVGQKKTKSYLASIFSKLRSDDEKAAKSLTHLSEKQHQTQQEQREQYRQCLELAVDCGIDVASEEYFFLSEEKFKDEQSRDSFLIMKTHEARRSWIARAFERRHRN